MLEQDYNKIKYAVAKPAHPSALSTELNTGESHKSHSDDRDQSRHGEHPGAEHDILLKEWRSRRGSHTT
jgi:hypothetical protein